MGILWQLQVPFLYKIGLFYNAWDLIQLLTIDEIRLIYNVWKAITEGTATPECHCAYWVGGCNGRLLTSSTSALV